MIASVTPDKSSPLVHSMPLNRTKHGAHFSVHPQMGMYEVFLTREHRTLGRRLSSHRDDTRSPALQHKLDVIGRLTKNFSRNT